MTALASGNPFGTLIGAPDLKARERSHLRRGLVVSGALHLALLAALLPLWSHGGDALLQTIPGDVYVLRAPPPPAVPLPPVDTPQPPGRPTAVDDGILMPVVDSPAILPTPQARPLIDPDPVGVAGTGAPGPPPPAGGQAGAQALEDEPIFQVFDEPPVPVFAPKPDYPDWARDAGVSGRVLIRALVGSDGVVHRVEVLEGITGLSEPARAAVSRWTFRPAKSNGKAVRVWVVVPILFRL